MRSLLKYLGITAHKIRGKTFWEANAPILHELWAQVQAKARERLIALHPDRDGGDEEGAKQLNQALRYARESFHWHLQSVKKTDTSQVVVIRRRRKGVRGGFRYPEKVSAVMACLQRGMSKKETIAETGVCWETITNIIKITPLSPCRCGKKALHAGTCFFTDKKRNVTPERQREISLHASQAAKEAYERRKANGEPLTARQYKRGYRNGPHSLETKIKIGEGVLRSWNNKTALQATLLSTTTGMPIIDSQAATLEKTHGHI